APDRVVVASFVQGWPWVGSHDLLAFAWGFHAVGGRSFNACAGSTASAEPSASCQRAFPENGSTWGTAFGEIRGIGDAGTLADVSWGSSATAASGAIALTAGAAAAS